MRISDWISDVCSSDLLHDFAREIGFRRTWFQGHRFPNHYDITTSAAARRAVLAGARCVAGMKDLLRILPGSRYFQEGYIPDLLDAEAAGRRNTQLLRVFAPGRRIGRRGTAHLMPGSECRVSCLLPQVEIGRAQARTPVTN